MSVLIAPDSFKGTYSAVEVATAIADGVRHGGVAAVELPVADGGEGTLDVLKGPLGLTIVNVEAVNPWHACASGQIGIATDGTALMEIASVSGITNAHNGSRDPIAADTYGTGLLMLHARALGATRIVVAAGGSATTDGGAGAIRAIDHAGGLGGARVEVLTDVTTRFEDAARVFAPQKGADDAAVEILSSRLRGYADSWAKDVRELPGSGAAGGFAGGMAARFGALLLPGADFVLDAIGFDDHMASAGAVVVGEGRLDSQSVAGKIVSAILARSNDVPVTAVVGSVGEDLGEFRRVFADVMVATDADLMRKAGLALAHKVNLCS